MMTREAGALPATPGSTVRDRLWLWGHDAGAHNDSWGLPRPSRITPAEAAFYLGVPNLIMVRYLGRPSPPFDQYAVPFQPLKRVVWSVVGATGRTDEEERDHVLDLAARHPNITGVMLDDFFAGASRESATEGHRAALPLDKLRELRSQLAVAGRRLDLWAVLYEHQLEKPLAEHLELVDQVSLWTWDSEKLTGLEANLERLEALSPQSGKVLGCYLWDYGKRQAMPLDLMKYQCELGLAWLKQGHIEGMIFLASCICDLGLEAVEWTRQWIADVGEQLVQGHGP
jgi:hypothetical protein